MVTNIKVRRLANKSAYLITAYFNSCIRECLEHLNCLSVDLSVLGSKQELIGHQKISLEPTNKLKCLEATSPDRKRRKLCKFGPV